MRTNTWCDYDIWTRKRATRSIYWASTRSAGWNIYTTWNHGLKSKTSKTRNNILSLESWSWWHKRGLSPAPRPWMTIWVGVSWSEKPGICNVNHTQHLRRTFVVHAQEMGWSPQLVNVLHWTWRLWLHETIHCTDWQDQEEDDGNKLLMIWNRWVEREMAPMLFPFFLYYWENCYLCSQFDCIWTLSSYCLHCQPCFWCLPFGVGGCLKKGGWIGWRLTETCLVLTTPSTTKKR